MARKKPLDAGPMEKLEGPGSVKSRRNASLRMLLLIVSAIATVAVLILIFVFKPPFAPPEEMKIDVFLDGATPFFYGQMATAKAFSTCGPFDLFLDSREVASGDSRAQAVLQPAAGRHTIEAKNAKCNALLSFMVLEKECNGGEQKDCVSEGCPGVQTCVNGAYTPCLLPKKICVPGTKLGCSTNGCAFGYEDCNACGTGFGPCTPRGGASTDSGPCIGEACG
ncbi:Uncharacterised protein [uncultured archaeon]|nr:Uncharacterised protein [uncultured archaeon]